MGTRGTWLAVRTSVMQCTLRTSRRRRVHARGVSLIELLMVVTIIGVFVSMAAPSIVSTMQDRHAARGADEVSNIFRRARTRAAAYGSAHLVRVTAGSTNLRFELLAAIDPATGSPFSSCINNPWVSGGTDNRRLDMVDFDAGGTYVGKNLQVTGVTGDYCWTPQGTEWVKSGGSWARRTGDQRLDVTIQRLDETNTPFGIIRIVRVPISGMPRIEVI